MTPSLSQGYVTFDTHLAIVSSVVGSLPLGQSSFPPPLAFGPLLTLPFSLPVDGTPAVQAQYLMVYAQKLQGMTLSLQPTLAAPLFTPEVPL